MPGPQDTATLAAGCIRIAVQNMANAIKKISVQRGHDITAYTLTCFGGAAGQHACLVADRARHAQRLSFIRWPGVLVGVWHRPRGHHRDAPARPSCP